MDVNEIELGLKHCSSIGVTLSVEEVSGLQAGLLRLQEFQKFDKVFFWGKILGTEKDYYICYGLQSNKYAFPDKVFYWAQENFDFASLPDDIEVEDFLGRFEGRPEKNLGEPVGEEAEEGGEESTKPVVTELMRLSKVVREVDSNTSVVPKGAYVLDENLEVMPALGFKGLSCKDAKEIESYLHYRPAENVGALRGIARDDVEFHENFLDSLVSDLPKGCWTIRRDAGCTSVQLRSLLWPGYVAYHIPCSTHFGGTYIGTGEKVVDLPFLLP